jgi:hypothetical protein
MILSSAPLSMASAKLHLLAATNAMTSIKRKLNVMMIMIATNPM